MCSKRGFVSLMFGGCLNGMKSRFALEGRRTPSLAKNNAPEAEAIK